ncbi:hypothetical protein PENTCL1PPCAC_907, partial [Pristionchus entomophagus]
IGLCGSVVCTTECCAINTTPDSIFYLYSLIVSLSLQLDELLGDEGLSVPDECISHRSDPVVLRLQNLDQLADLLLASCLQVDRGHLEASEHIPCDESRHEILTIRRVQRVSKSVKVVGLKGAHVCQRTRAGNGCHFF